MDQPSASHRASYQLRCRGSRAVESVRHVLTSRISRRHVTYSRTRQFCSRTVEMANRAKELRRMLAVLIEARERLEPYKISTAAHYAEYLFATATGGKRANGPTPAYDVLAPNGKIQVKA